MLELKIQKLLCLYFALPHYILQIKIKEKTHLNISVLLQNLITPHCRVISISFGRFYTDNKYFKIKSIYSDTLLIF